MYNRKQSETLLTKEYGFKTTHEKHEENVFTRWYQSFYLFEKFAIDKRKAHLSSLINSGQMTRDEALAELAKSPVYPELGLEKKVMQYPKRPYTDFRTDERLFNAISRFVKLLS